MCLPAALPRSCVVEARVVGHLEAPAVAVHIGTTGAVAVLVARVAFPVSLVTLRAGADAVPGVPPSVAGAVPLAAAISLAIGLPGGVVVAHMAGLNHDDCPHPSGGHGDSSHD